MKLQVCSIDTNKYEYESFLAECDVIGMAMII